MTKERLEELIKQRAIIYYASEYTAIELDFDNVIAEVCGNTLYCQNGFRFCIKDLFETEEQALWALRTVAERTERFEPPMWEDFNHYEFQFINHENGGTRKIIFEVLKKQDDKAKTGGYISILNTTLLKDIYEVDTPTKENYEKACEIVRDLFKGEK